MRWLLLFLIICNLLAYVWYRQAPVDFRAAPPASAAAPIRLLSELPPEALLPRKELPRKELASEARPAPQRTVGVPAVDLPPAGENSEQGTTEVELPGVPEPVPSGLAAAPEPPADAPEPAFFAPTEPGRQCYTLSGGVAEREVAALLKQLEDAAMSVVFVRRLEPSGREGYWVYIPDTGADGSMDQARARLQRLGIESYLVTRGVLKGQLSVGLYRNPDSARALYRALQEYGFAVRMMLRAEPGRQAYLIDLWADQQQWEALRALSVQGGIWRLEKSAKKLCEGVAEPESSG